MTLTIVREPTLDGVTLGSLYLDGARFCDTLEDAVREDGRPVAEWKVPRQSAIPQGTYPLILSLSKRFKRLLPEVLNVPGFSGIRIHPGNTIADTEGCVLVGSSRHGQSILGSRITMERLMERLATVTGPMTIEFRNAV